MPVYNQERSHRPWYKALNSCQVSINDHISHNQLFNLTFKCIKNLLQSNAGNCPAFHLNYF